MKSIYEVLKSAHALIADRKNWCQGAYARNAVGEGTDAIAEDACQFCAMGAIDRIVYAGPDSLRDKDDLREDVSNVLIKHTPRGYHGIISTNDHGGHDCVMKMYAGAIAEADWLEMEAW